MTLLSQKSLEAVARTLKSEYAKKQCNARKKYMFPFRESYRETVKSE